MYIWIQQVIISIYQSYNLTVIPHLRKIWQQKWYLSKNVWNIYRKHFDCILNADLNLFTFQPTCSLLDQYLAQQQTGLCPVVIDWLKAFLWRTKNLVCKLTVIQRLSFYVKIIFYRLRFNSSRKNYMNQDENR